MSMIYVLHQASDQSIENLLAEPQSVLKFLDMERNFDTTNRGCLWLLFTMFHGNRSDAAVADSNKSEIASADTSENNGESCDLDKSWHGLHFLLSGSDWQGEPPEAFLLNWGEVIRDVDIAGYGPARAFTHAQTTEIADCLDSLDPVELRERFDPEQMMRDDIYPTIWDRDPAEDDTLGYLLEYFHTLRQFVRQTANQGKGMVVFLT
jgi:hypothetical protein